MEPTPTVNWILNRVEQTTQRYIEAEEFIQSLPWIVRLFYGKRINRFFINTLDKYNF